TPTQLAAELGVKYSTGNPNPRKVNSLLEQLGYQVKIQGQWSATEKAIAAKLCDRKPVDTNSRTQKDQLLWSEDVIAVLSEHSVP
ncbi:MAG: transcriptional regulator, partial [Cyanobacteria bacterium J06638_38]